jgi:hypothetical protein
MECSVTEAALDTVEAPVASECLVGPSREAGHGLQCLLGFILLWFLGWDVDFFIPLLRLAERATWQLATLVGHEAAAFIENHILQVQHPTRTKLEKRYPLSTRQMTYKHGVPYEDPLPTTYSI